MNGAVESVAELPWVFASVSPHPCVTGPCWQVFGNGTRLCSLDQFTGQYARVRRLNRWTCASERFWHVPLADLFVDRAAALGEFRRRRALCRTLAVLG